MSPRAIVMLLVRLATQSVATAMHICSYEFDIDYGRDSRTNITSTTREGCCEACWRRKCCAVAIFFFDQSICWLKPKEALNRPNPQRGAIACRIGGRHSFMNTSLATRGIISAARFSRETGRMRRARLQVGELECAEGAPARNGLPRPHDNTSIIAYTIAGGDWSQYIPLIMSAWRHAGLSVLVVAAMDWRAHNSSCQHATHAIHTPLAKSGFKTAVGHLKFTLAAVLARQGRALFMEMDVFLVRSPVALIAQVPANTIISWGHSNNPGMSNLGAYYTTGGPHVVYFFTQMANIMLENNATRYPALWNMAGPGNVWDQWTFNCAASCWSYINVMSYCNNNCRDFDTVKHCDLRFIRGDSRDVHASANFDVFQLSLPRGW